MSTKDELANLLRRRRIEERQLGEGAAQRKGQWLDDLDSLLKDIESWLRRLKSQGLLDFKRETVRISEELLGEYDAPGLSISTPLGRKVSVIPVGTYVVNAIGRVDLVSGPRREMLARFDKKKGWHVMRHAPDLGSWESSPLDEDFFLELITDLIE